MGPVTAQDPHAAPRNIVINPGDGRVTLDWDDPKDPDIDRYQFRYKRSDRLWSAWADIPSSSADTTTVTLTGLQNGVSYRFQIRAVSNAHDPQVLINDNRDD
ncbi:MAG: fibronectin type III domain-containing protein, partial [Thiotrichales bacterium]|nr:fibronectin type III domain-containing protein [Thiotrichales bacterium]